MNNLEYDVAIVGAGPAGAAAALSLPSELRIAHIDSGFPNHAKLCGGLLTEEAMASVRIITGVTELPSDVACEPNYSVLRSVDFDNHVTTTMNVGYLNICRSSFDRWLLSLVSRDEYKTLWGVKARSIKKNGRHFEINCHRDGERFTILTRFIIDCSGWASLSRKSPSLGCAPRRFALQIALPYSKETEYQAFFSKEYTDWFGWTIPKNDKLLVGIGFRRNDELTTAGGSIKPNEDLAINVNEEANENDESSFGTNDYRETDRDNPWLPGAFIAFLSRLREAGYVPHIDLPDPRDRMGVKTFFGRNSVYGCPITALTSIKQINFGREGLFLAGEAAGLCSPSSGDGISFALASGIALGQVFRRMLIKHRLKDRARARDYRLYRDLLASEIRELRFNIQKAKMLANPKLRNAAFKFLSWHNGKPVERL